MCTIPSKFSLQLLLFYLFISPLITPKTFLKTQIKQSLNSLIYFCYGNLTPFLSNPINYSYNSDTIACLTQTRRIINLLVSIHMVLSLQIVLPFQNHLSQPILCHSKPSLYDLVLKSAWVNHTSFTTNCHRRFILSQIRQQSIFIEFIQIKS